jgi:hypothetical protein
MRPLDRRPYLLGCGYRHVGVVLTRIMAMKQPVINIVAATYDAQAEATQKATSQTYYCICITETCLDRHETGLSFTIRVGHDV